MKLLVKSSDNSKTHHANDWHEQNLNASGCGEDKEKDEDKTSVEIKRRR